MGDLTTGTNGYTDRQKETEKDGVQKWEWVLFLANLSAPLASFTLIFTHPDLSVSLFRYKMNVQGVE